LCANGESQFCPRVDDLWPAESGRGIRDADRAREIATHRFKCSKLRLRRGIIQLIGTGEVRHQAQLAYSSGCFEARQQLRGRVGRESKAVHAGIEFQPDGARGFTDTLQHLDLLDIVHDQLEVLRKCDPEFFGPIRAAAELRVNARRQTSLPHRDAAPRQPELRVNARRQTSLPHRDAAPRQPCRGRMHWP
jgi:hypothetical protein